MKPPEWEDHVCETPQLDGMVRSEEQRHRYENCIWRCDLCLSVYILKIIENKKEDRQWLLWRWYDFTTG